MKTYERPAIERREWIEGLLHMLNPTRGGSAVTIQPPPRTRR